MPNPMFGYAGSPYGGWANPYAVQPPRVNSNPVTLAMGGNQMMNTPMNTPQSFVPQSNIIWVNGEEEISNYPTGRGWQQLFGDKNKNMFYIRETDLNGITQPVRRLHYEFEETQAPAPANQPQAAPTENPVTREEFDKLVGAVSSMTDKLSELLK